MKVGRKEKVIKRDQKGENISEKHKNFKEESKEIHKNCEKEVKRDQKNSQKQ